MTVISKKLPKLGPGLVASMAGSGREAAGQLSGLVGGYGRTGTAGDERAASQRTRLPATQVCPADPKTEARTSWHSAKGGFPPTKP